MHQLMRTAPGLHSIRLRSQASSLCRHSRAGRRPDVPASITAITIITSYTRGFEKGTTGTTGAQPTIHCCMREATPCCAAATRGPCNTPAACTSACKPPTATCRHLAHIGRPQWPQCTTSAAYAAAHAAAHAAVHPALQERNHPSSNCLHQASLLLPHSSLGTRHH